MGAPEIFISCLSEAEYQLQQVFAGITATQWDFKPLPSMMSAGETLEHLCECVVAADELAEGKDHDWSVGFTHEFASNEELLAHFFSFRQRVVERLLASDDPKLWAALKSFVLLHECYHVGQLCQVRFGLDSDWNPYSIYKMD